MNCVTKVVNLFETPRLILVTNQKVLAGSELLFDYGDRLADAVIIYKKLFYSYFHFLGAKKVLRPIPGLPSRWTHWLVNFFFCAWLGK